MAKIRDVAKQAGVSISTVSLALNQKERVSEKTFRKVAKAAEETGYVANPIAQSLRKGASPFISMIVTDISTSFANKFLRELEMRAFEKGYLITLSDKSGVARDEEVIVRQLIAQRIAGLLISPTQATRPLIPLLKAAKIPLVQFDHCLTDTNCDFVGLDNQLAISILTRHLIGLGHVHIGLIRGIPGYWTSDEREKGYLDTMNANHLEVVDGMVVNGLFTRAGGYQAAMKLLVAPNPVTAIIAANNEMAVGAIKAAKELGFQYPENISICCTDGLPWGDVFTPLITYVAQPVEEMAEQACKWLMERIENKDVESPARTAIFAPTFVNGSSCAAPRNKTVSRIIKTKG